MTKRIAVINQKGGVGKTTTTVNLGSALAGLTNSSGKGNRILFVDLDAQANLSTHLGVLASEGEGGDYAVGDSTEPQATTYELLKGQKTAKEVRIERTESLHVIPSSLLLSAADLEFGGVVGRELLLKRAIDPIVNEYDYVLIDCPPALGLLSLNALAAAQQVVIPVQSEYLALHGVRQLLDTIDQVRQVYNPALAVGGVLICLHDSRKRLARAVADTIHSYFGDLVFKTVIRSNVALAEAPSAGQNIFEYAPKSTGAEDYTALATEVQNGN